MYVTCIYFNVFLFSKEMVTCYVRIIYYSYLSKLLNPATGVLLLWWDVLFGGFVLNSAVFLSKNFNFLFNAKSKRRCILNSLFFSRSAKVVHSLDCTHKGLASSENLFNINLTN